MTDLEKIKNEVAVEHGYEDFNDMLCETSVGKSNDIIDYIMQRYADHVEEEERNNLTNWFNLHQEVMDFVIAELGDEFVNLELPEGDLESGKFLIKALAELKCKEQREICAKAAKITHHYEHSTDFEGTPEINIKSILEAPLATSKTT
jgi:hypothetical protein